MIEFDPLRGLSQDMWHGVDHDNVTYLDNWVTRIAYQIHNKYRTDPNIDPELLEYCGDPFFMTDRDKRDYIIAFKRAHRVAFLSDAL